MAGYKRVKIRARVGDPSSGVIIQPGAVIDLPEFWADKYIANGSAIAVETEPVNEPEAEKPRAKKPAKKAEK